MQTGEYLEIWLDTYVTPFRAPSTAACYRRAIAALPARLLALDLQELTGLHIQQAINRKATRHPRAAQLMFAMFSVALGRAMRLGMIDRNPILGVEKPVHRPRTAATWTAEQLAQYLTAARANEHYPLLLLMAIAGLRRGEALGLRWADIDGDMLRIHQQRQRVPGKGLQLRPLKSRTSNRCIPLPAAVLEELRGWTERSMRGFVVDTTPERLARAHAAVTAAAQLPPITLHGLRHSMATAMAEQGTPIKLLQGILGHSHYQLTADLYAAHMTADAFRQPMELYSRHFFASVGFQGAVRV